jgi:predicted outer membrane repeat protein
MWKWGLFLILAGCESKNTDVNVGDIEDTGYTVSDIDGDGFTVEDGDCDDEDPNTAPGFVEICDGVDNNCDGAVDEGVTTSWYADEDGDGYGDDASETEACEPPSGYIPVGGDCDDTESSILPSAAEVCDEVDNDCDGLIDFDDDSMSTHGLSTYYTDADGDGYGDDETATQGCEAPQGAVTESGDCDDTDSAFNPGADESDCTDSADYNCDGSVGYADADGDGYAACEECDDADSAINPDADEVCDGTDNDCDALIDDEDEISEEYLDTFYADDDADGFGDSTNTTDACDVPSGYVTDTTDCDDADSAVNPDATEVCNEIDDDCDGTIDVGAKEDATWYADADGDGFGDSTDTTTGCEQPSGYVSNDTDCDDADSAVSPDGEEVCDSIDNDCDGTTDEDPTDGTTYYADADGDGFGDSSSFTSACDVPSGYVSLDTDCDDSDSAVSPDADEVCDDVDNDCDSIIDEDPTDGTTYYADADGDTYGDADSTTDACDVPSGYTADDTDCDDADSAVNPDADEVCDGADNDCDGTTDVGASDAGTFYADADGDTYGDADSTTDACDAPSGYTADDTDCDDADSAVNPDADEVCDGVDNNCDGTTDEDTATDAETWYADADSDGFGDADSTTAACDQPSGYIEDSADCDDSDSAVNPDADEVCDGIDNDCDGTTDVGATDATTYYLDTDGDGYGDADTATDSCDELSGYLTDGTDCDDGDDTIYPGATEYCDGIDSNCDDSSTDDGLASFEATDGTWTDLTDTLAAGTSTSPAAWELSDDGILWLCDGTWYDIVDVTASDAEIRSLNGSALTTLSAANTDTVVTSGSGALDIDGLTITEGSNTTSCGGGIDANNTTLSLSDLIVTGNAALDGAGLCQDSGTVTISDVEFSDNLVDDDGAAVYLSSTTAALSTVILSENLAVDDGGGLFATNTTLTLSDVLFDSNESGARGGGLYATQSTVTATGLEVSANISTDEGGGIAIRSSSELTISASTISDNESSDDDGGGISVKDSDLWLTSSTVSDNIASDKGGGICLDSSDAELDDVLLSDNLAEEGGGLFVEDGLASLTDSEVSDNTSGDDDGGGVTVDEGGELEVSSTDWSGNDPDDVYLADPDVTYSYGTSESFTCDDQECW